MTASRLTVIPGLDPATYQRSALHGEACAWPEKNCYVDLFVGLAMNFDRPFEIGHFIRIQNGPAGQVVEINWRTTRIVDGRLDLALMPDDASICH